MPISMDYIFWGSLVVVLNVLDSVTTRIGLYGLPVELRAKETNPFMGWVIGKSHLLADIIKQVFVLGLVALYAYWQNLPTLILFAVLLSMIVVGNIYLLVARLVTKRKVNSPLFYLFRLCRIPQQWDYLFVIVIYLPLGMWIMSFITGGM